ncbi:GumC family protein [Kamptonema formosum]|uniref:GumC family protein n=1 Tax=Kamptonema formosum TaxID=331992 RepID=UPI0003752453|nr:polysaccharide biosynthesis tyrosine autokinase [Oscillatoria sp. PCC 10802]
MLPSIVKRYLIAVGKYKWFGMVAFVTVLGGAAFVAVKQQPPPKMFQAEGLLSYSPPKTGFSNTAPQILEQGKALPKEVLLSPEVIKKVAALLKEDPNKIKDSAGVWLPEKVEPTATINVQFKSPEPEKAQAGLVALMQTMVEQSRFINAQRVRATKEALNKRLIPVRKELDEAEKALENFDRVEGAVLSVARIGALPAAVATVQDQQRQLRMAVQGYDAQIRSLSERLGLTPAQASVSQALSADPIIANLRAQLHDTESQLQYYQQSLRDDHPQMVELRQRQTALQELLQQRSAEVIGGNGVAASTMSDFQIRQNSSLDPVRQQLAATLMGFQTERERLQQQLQAAVQTEQELRREYASIPNKQLDRSRKEQQVLIKKTLYDKIQAALADAETADAETESSLTIPPQQPQIASLSKPNPSIVLILGGGGLVGAAVGGALIFLLSMLEGKFYTEEEVRSAFEEREVEVLGTLPAVMVLDAQPDLMPVMLQLDSPYLESYERLRTNLRRAGDKPVKVLLLTSAGTGEGKTFCAYNLAIASARAGKRTLLIEADLRSPSRVGCLKMTADPDNSLEPLLYYGQLNNCIRLVPEIENLYVVPSSGPVRQPGGILESNEMLRLLKDVRQRFDFIVLDAPALSAGNDALMLEPHTDGMVFVARPLHSEQGMVAEYLDSLTESEDITLLGGVVNGAEMPVEAVEAVEAHSTYPEPEPPVEEPAQPDEPAIPGRLQVLPHPKQAERPHAARRRA